MGKHQKRAQTALRRRLVRLVSVLKLARQVFCTGTTAHLCQLGVHDRVGHDPVFIQHRPYSILHAERVSRAHFASMRALLRYLQVEHVKEGSLAELFCRDEGSFAVPAGGSAAVARLPAAYIHVTQRLMWVIY